MNQTDRLKHLARLRADAEGFRRDVGLGRAVREYDRLLGKALLFKADYAADIAYKLAHIQANQATGAKFVIEVLRCGVWLRHRADPADLMPKTFPSRKTASEYARQVLTAYQWRVAPRGY